MALAQVFLSVFSTISTVPGNPLPGTTNTERLALPGPVRNSYHSVSNVIISKPSEYFWNLKSMQIIFPSGSDIFFSKKNSVFSCLSSFI